MDTPFFLRGLHDLKQHLCLALGKGCRGLIHDDDFLRPPSGPLTNFYHLLLSHGSSDILQSVGMAGPRRF